MRYAYALTTALALSGAAAAMTLNVPAGAQTAQNEPGAIQAAAPRGGAPMSFADMVAKLQPAVVNISTTQRIRQQQQANPFAGTPFEQLVPQQRGPSSQKAESLGSGFIISADGYVVTNSHVISAGAAGATVESITVTLPDRREFKARLVGRDPLSDLAVLKIEGTNLPFVRFGDSRQARVGDWVVAIGNPFGLGGSVTAGIISATHRVTGSGSAYDRFIQTDASINRGNSGGPMFDLNGNVIGINSQILSPTGGNVGIGFAIPAEQAKPVVDTLMKGGKVSRGYLGVSQQPLTRDIAGALGIPADKGALVASTVPGEAAEKAGLKQGDVIVRVNNQDVTEEQTLSFLTANLAPGTRVPIEILRDGKRQTLTVTLGTRPAEIDALDTPDDDGIPDGGEGGAAAPSAAATLGLSVQPLTPQIARSIGVDATIRGVVVANVGPDSDAAGKGLQRGDVVVNANGTPTLTAADLARAVAAAKTAGRPSVLLYVQRQKQGQYVVVDLAE